MKLLMLFANGFEDTEAVATLDVIERGGDEVVCASLMPTAAVATKCGNVLAVPVTLAQIDPYRFDGLIIPGGPASFKVMPSMPVVSELITHYYKSGKLTAAICAAPHLIGKLGYLKDKNYTVHPGFETQVVGGNYLRSQGVVRDGNVITAKSMYYSVEFGLAIHAYFHGEESKEKLRLSCMGEA